MQPFYITTPIYYVNARPHLGHAYSTIAADAITRLRRMCGDDTLFLTGTDEHGDKIVQAAEKNGMSPMAFADEISASFRKLWPGLHIEHDLFRRTTDAAHMAAVRDFLQRVYDAGDIYFGEFGGYYCYGCERFYTEKELENGLCPQHQTAPKFISEKNYFFRMSKYLPWLKGYIEANPDLIRPDRYRAEALAMLEEGVLEDLCISRPKSRLEWGIELPFDKNYVCYVWFDALIAYLSGAGWPDGDNFRKFWPGEHLIAKDILKPHAIFWPCMLKAAGIPVYRHLNVHGYWLNREAKMSKSLGNVIEPEACVERYGVDAFRYFLLRDMRFGSDANFGEATVVARINADLANDLGNLFSRVLSMNAKYFGAKAPQNSAATAEDEAVIATCLEAAANFISLFYGMRMARALEALWAAVSALNKYVDAQAPWTLFKEGRMDRLAQVLALALAGMRKVAVCLWPVMPHASARMLAQLGQPMYEDGAPPTCELRKEAEQFLYLDAGASLAESSALFPRMEAAETPARQMPGKSRKKTGAPTAAGLENIEFESFKRIDMAVGTVLKAERHPDADRLLVLEIDFGEEKPRQIVSGLAEFYSPEELPGQQVCAVLNLAPRKIRGIASNGMVLTAGANGQTKLLRPWGDMPRGSRIS